MARFRHDLRVKDINAPESYRRPVGKKLVVIQARWVERFFNYGMCWYLNGAWNDRLL